MGTVRTSGFTIIETMLFLGISGVLAIAILATSATAINQQRYRDSVNSLKDLIQSQYTDTANVINDRSEAWKCDANGLVTPEGSPAAQEYRGASECVALGRSIVVSGAGSTITISSITARLPAGSLPDPTNDFAALRQYRYALSPIDTITTSPEWGTRVVRPGGADEAVSIFIVRSPYSGLVRTFIADNAPSVNSVMTSGSLAANPARTLCLDSASFFTGPRLGVRIQANAGSQSAVESLGDAGGC